MSTTRTGRYLGMSLCEMFSESSMAVQRLAKKYANLAKQDPGRARQNS